jgi:hypothetical protein
MSTQTIMWLTMSAILLFSGCNHFISQTQQMISDSLRTSDRMRVTVYSIVPGPPPQSFAIDDKTTLSKLADAFRIKSTFHSQVTQVACCFRVEVALAEDKGFTIMGGEPDATIVFYPDIHLDQSFQPGYCFGKIDGEFVRRLEQALGDRTLLQIWEGGNTREDNQPHP